MGKALLYRLFKLGRVSQELAATCGQEGIVLLDEGISSSVTYHNFRAPGRYSNWKRRWFPGALVLTKSRIVATAYHSPIINLPLSDPRLGQMQLTLERDDRICLAFDPSILKPESSGHVECRFTTPLAKQFFEALQKHTARAR